MAVGFHITISNSLKPIAMTCETRCEVARRPIAGKFVELIHSSELGSEIRFMARQSIKIRSGTGHKSRAAYMNYSHGDKEQAKALADQLATLATGLGKAAANVISLPKKEDRG